MISASLSPATRLLAHDPAQVAGEIGVGIVDRLVLADQAAQLLGQPARALLERRVVQDLEPSTPASSGCSARPSS